MRFGGGSAHAGLVASKDWVVVILEDDVLVILDEVVVQLVFSTTLKLGLSFGLLLLILGPPGFKPLSIHHGPACSLPRTPVGERSVVGGHDRWLNLGRNVLGLRVDNGAVGLTGEASALKRESHHRFADELVPGRRLGVYVHPYFLSRLAHESYNQNLWIDHPLEGAAYLPC